MKRFNMGRRAVCGARWGVAVLFLLAGALTVNSIAQTTATQSKASGQSVSGEPTDPLAALAGQKVMHGAPSDKRIALTFDDGPHPKLTPRLIELLKREDVPANFFWVGEKVRDYPDAAKATADAGFEIGNHSWSHPMLPKLSMDEIRKQIGDTQDLIEKITGRRPQLMRPPGGAADAKVKEVCKQMGLAIILWSVDPRDWAQGATADSIYQKVMAQAHPGAIVCIHETHERTLEALPRIIKDLRDKGYQFTTVSQLIIEAAKRKQLEPSGDAQGGGGEAMGMGATQAAPPPLVISLEDTTLK